MMMLYHLQLDEYNQEPLNKKNQFKKKEKNILTLHGIASVASR